MVPPYYSEYPNTIKKNRIYFYRSRKTLKILPCRVININSENSYNIYSESVGVVTAERPELLSFDPNSRLFKNLMRLGVYRENKEIKQALKFLGLEPARFMMYHPEEISKRDSDISEENFARLMRNFAESKDPAYKREINVLLESPLPGTLGLNLHGLYRIVCESGGMDNVINLQIWKKLFFRYMEKTNASYVMRTLYKKYLYEFELERRNAEDVGYNFAYCYRRGDHVTFVGKNKHVLCGEVVAMRNKGINVYYVQFLGWNTENNEWISEDILSKCAQDIEVCRSLSATPSKSSKANNLVDDPVTWEKHRHGFNFGIKADNIMIVNKFFVNTKGKSNRYEGEKTQNGSQKNLDKRETPPSSNICERPCKVGKNKRRFTMNRSGVSRDHMRDSKGGKDREGSIKTLADVCARLIPDRGDPIMPREADVKPLYEKENHREEELSEYNFATYKMQKKEKKAHNGYLL